MYAAPTEIGPFDAEAGFIPALDFRIFQVLSSQISVPRDTGLSKDRCPVELGRSRDVSFVD